MPGYLIVRRKPWGRCNECHHAIDDHWVSVDQGKLIGGCLSIEGLPPGRSCTCECVRRSGVLFSGDDDDTDGA